MIIIMIFMTTSFMQFTISPIFSPFLPAAKMPAPTKIAITITGSMFALTIGARMLSGKIPTITCITLGASFAAYSSSASSALGRGGKNPLKADASARPITTATAVVII